jgi:PDZ domain-containing protein
VAAIAAVLLLGLLVLPVPYVKQSPGPIFNTIGTFDDKELIAISGTSTYPPEGSLGLVTVTERGGPFGILLLGEALLGWVNPDVAIVPRSALYPEELSEEHARTRNRVAFGNSQGNAISAALGHLGLPIVTSVLVSGVVEDGPSAGRFEIGDQITGVDGENIANTEDLVKRVRAQKPGAEIEFDVVREGRAERIAIKSQAASDDPKAASVGIFINNDVKAEFEIDFALDSIGGPSAGLMFALGIIDELTPGNLTQGEKVAGTGTVTPDGEVGPIGGLWQKLAAASKQDVELFLLPADNCDDVNRSEFRGMPLVPVKNVTEAVDYLRRWATDGPGSLPRCVGTEIG